LGKSQIGFALSFRVTGKLALEARSGCHLKTGFIQQFLGKEFNNYFRRILFLKKLFKRNTIILKQVFTFS